MTAIEWADPARAARFQTWFSSLVNLHGLDASSLELANNDASSRRYLRCQSEQGSRIIMDDPAQPNQLKPFLAVAAQLQACDLHAPAVLAADAEQGFALIEDLGRQTYLQALQQASPVEADRLMRAAIAALLQWQSRADASQLPVYDEAFVRRELQIFIDWCVEREHGQRWDGVELQWWQRTCDLLVTNMLSQPQLAMHRDFMPRNLMVCADGPGILDFQDAVCGPISYDLVSLLRDAFISWDEERELDWAIRYWEQARKLGLPVGDDFGEFWRQLEWTGLQRHLKVLGIYCRLKHRDGKPRYAEDLPRFFAYAIKVSTRYIELSPLTRLLEKLRGSLVQTGFNLR
ncbi:phosphotransferase [Paucibacter sp. APW11]|uniref:Phosphotransferase n=1 Tax=Roseateles aquae TaxID=3077235 RepID=A0ABU3PA37_9BURK|nr:phosphotransferase [Paucibacter sp. APW11]MDT8999432.1 phosphotransferase [Paucibacter sp. APW11]